MDTGTAREETRNWQAGDVSGDLLASRNMRAEPPGRAEPGLKMVVIDGSNVACEYGKHQRVFDCRGILVAVQFFLNRGHDRVLALVPRSRSKMASRCAPTPTRYGHIIANLQRQGLLEYTPSRCIDGEWQISHEDAFILKVAEAEDAVVVSNDQYRSFLAHPQYGKVVRQRLLSYMIAVGKIYFPDDPFGMRKISLNELLKTGKREIELPKGHLQPCSSPAKDRTKSSKSTVNEEVNTPDPGFYIIRGIQVPSAHKLKDYILANNPVEVRDGCTKAAAAMIPRRFEEWLSLAMEQWFLAALYTHVEGCSEVLLRGAAAADLLLLLRRAVDSCTDARWTPNMFFWEGRLKEFLVSGTQPPTPFGPLRLPEFDPDKTLSAAAITNRKNRFSKLMSAVQKRWLRQDYTPLHSLPEFGIDPSCIHKIGETVKMAKQSATENGHVFNSPVSRLLCNVVEKRPLAFGAVEVREFGDNGCERRRRRRRWR